MFSKMIIRVGTLLPLLVGSTAIVGGNILWTMVARPAPAIAQTTFNTNLLLQVADQETYSVLVSRAEVNAEVKVQELFDQDLLRTEVRLTVLGQNGAAIAPVLKLRVSRQEWTSYPDPEIWSVYYPESQILLNFLEEATPEPEPEEVVPIIEETQPTETFITPAGETPLNNESTPEPADSETMVEEAETEAGAEMTTPESTSEPADSETLMEEEVIETNEEMPTPEDNTMENMKTDEEVRDPRSNTIRPQILRPAE